jgi:nitrite reductase/ring-hydroxylating ferredoxin subunit
MTWTKVLAETALNEGDRQVVKLDDRKLLVLKHAGKIHVVDNACPHMKLPMKKGKITADGQLVCPFHRTAFDLCSGKAANWTPFPPVVGPMMGKLSGTKDLPVFATKVENGDIWADL